MTSAIVGARNPQQIEETAKASEIVLPKAKIDAIEEILAWRINNI